MTVSVKKLELEGVMIYDTNKSIDERGFFAELFRKDWNNSFKDEFIVQANISYSYPGIIRAWHRHARGQVDYLAVLKGCMKVAVYDGEKDSQTYGKLVEIVIGEEKLQLVRIPGHFWHGTKSIGSKPSLTMYLMNKLYDYSNPDEERRPWNDPTIIDPKTSKSFDWNKLPHK